MNIQEAKKIEEQILKDLKRNIHAKDKIVVGISGGMDSVFLLHILKKLQEKIDFTIIVAHVNHGIREKDADQDEKFVKNLTQKPTKITKKLNEKSDLIFETKKANIPLLSRKSKTGLEETGRKIRYEFFHQLAKKYHAKFIVTAHHGDDNLETILGNFVRGANLKGLSGMQKMENNLHRPLLDLSKKQIENYLKFKKIPFQNDKTNQDLQYKRNFIRHEIIPKLQKLNPNLAETIAKNSQNFREIEMYLQNEARNWIKKNSLNKSFSEFPMKNLQKIPKALQKEILREIYFLTIGNYQNIESKHITEVLTLIEKNIGNKKKKFGRIIFYVNHGKLRSQLEKITKKSHY